MNVVQKCTICGGDRFTFHAVLWEELISDWELLPDEVEYINRQQGLTCEHCGNNLRSMALAYGILTTYDSFDTLEKFVESDIANNLKVLEINEAGGLNSVLNKLPDHKLITFPEYDMQQLAFDDAEFDLVLHSDSLEHIPDPVKGLSECRRVLKEDGLCLFTVPIVIDRLTRSRSGLKSSFHGSSSQENSDYLVHTEFGADMWKFTLLAGFNSTRIHSLCYPSGLVIEGVK